MSFSLTCWLLPLLYEGWSGARAALFWYNGEWVGIRLSGVLECVRSSREAAGVMAGDSNVAIGGAMSSSVGGGLMMDAPNGIEEAMIAALWCNEIASSKP